MFVESSWDASKGTYSVGSGVLDKTIRRTLGLEAALDDVKAGQGPRGQKRAASGDYIALSPTARTDPDNGDGKGQNLSAELTFDKDTASSDDDLIHLHQSNIILTIDPARNCGARDLKFLQQVDSLSKVVDLLADSIPEGSSLGLVGTFGIGAQGWITTETPATAATEKDFIVERLLQFPEAKLTPEQASESVAAGFGGTGRSSDWLFALCSLVASNHPGGNIFKVDVNLSISWQKARGNENLLGEIKPDLHHLSAFHKVLVFTIRLNISSSVARLCSTVDARLGENFRLVVQTFFPQHIDSQPATALETQSALTTLRTFYENLLPAPRIPSHVLRKLQPWRLQVELLEFQKRSVAFILGRENATHIDPIFQSDATDPFGFWENITIGDTNKVISFCRLTGTIRPSKLSGMSTKRQGKLSGLERGTFDAEVSHEKSILKLSHVRGSILADEMGLGKTLEVIAVILLNSGPDFKYQPRSAVRTTIDNSHAYVNWSSQLVQRVKATLIVVPASLVQQWFDEFNKHAPDVTVIRYEGWKKLEANYRKTAQPNEIENDSEEVDMEKPAKSFIRHIIDSNVEVVITDYNSLQSDFNVRLPPPRRPRRGGIEYGPQSEQPRSPIVGMHWWRLVIDETQLADPAGTTKIAETMRVIPRTYSLAVSGTPAKANTNDLYGSLHFIGLPLSSRQWQNLQRTYFSPAFTNLFERVCIRTTKKQLKGSHGLQEPPAKYIVPVELTPVEMQYYLEALEDSLESLKITPDGYPAVAPWFLDTPKLRSAIHLLRQTCSLSVHIAAQGRNRLKAPRGAMDAHAHKQLMTMKDALANMQWEAQNARWSSLRELASLQIEKAQMYGRLISIATREATANPGSRWLHLRERPDEKLLLRVRKELSVHITTLQDEANRLAPGYDGPDDNSELEDPPDNLQEASARHRAISYRGRRKDFLILKHRCCFLLGDVYHVAGQDEKEKEAYNEATHIRQSDILRVAAVRANRNTEIIAEAVKKSGVLGFPQMELDSMGEVGIYGRDARDAADATVDLLNDNAEHAWNWRGQIVRILNEPVDHDNEATGEEYQHTLKSQAMLEVFLANYAAILADRRAIMHEERTLLAAHEGRIEKRRKTRAAKNAEDEVNVDTRNLPDIDDDDEVEQLGIDLVNKRQILRQAHSDIGRPLRAIQIELNGKANRAIIPEEVALTRAAVQSIRQTIKAQTEIIQKLEEELDDFRKAFNIRVAYFKDLQALSDSVIEPTYGQVPLETQLDTTQHAINALEKGLALGQARLRYLHSLGEQRSDDQEDKCVLCLTPFSEVAQVVLLKSCGHAICSDCFFLYRGTAAGNRCLLCRSPITAGDVQKVAIAQKVEKKEEDPPLQLQGTSATGNVMPKLSDTIFSMFPELAKVEQTEIVGLWSSKIALLTKNIVFRQSYSPATKHVVFSAWRDALVIVKAALDQNDVRWVEVDDHRKSSDPVKVFTENPNITVFLLHGERSTSGLTLTAASVVHLLEPLINPSFEAQAIGRIDRLGQKSRTEVYCYATNDTIEAKILHAAVRQGTSNYVKYDSDTSYAVASGVAKRGGDDFSGSPDELLDMIL